MSHYKDSWPCFYVSVCVCVCVLCVRVCVCYKCVCVCVFACVECMYVISVVCKDRFLAVIPAKAPGLWRGRDSWRCGTFTVKCRFFHPALSPHALTLSTSLEAHRLPCSYGLVPIYTAVRVAARWCFVPRTGDLQAHNRHTLCYTMWVCSLVDIRSAKPAHSKVYIKPINALFELHIKTSSRSDSNLFALHFLT